MDVTVDQEATTQVSEAQHLWNAAAQVLRAQVSEAVWHSTFSDACPTSLDSGLLVMAVPSTLVKERIQGRYEAMVRDALAEVGVPGVELHIEVLPDVLPSGGELDGVDGFDSLLTTSTADAAPTLTLEPMPPRTAADLNPRYQFEAFVTGTSNRFAACGCPLRRGDAGTVVQPAVHLRSGRARQDPPAPRDRQLRQAELRPLPGPLRLD